MRRLCKVLSSRQLWGVTDKPIVLPYTFDATASEPTFRRFDCAHNELTIRSKRVGLHKPVPRQP